MPLNCLMAVYSIITASCSYINRISFEWLTFFSSTFGCIKRQSLKIVKIFKLSLLHIKKRRYGIFSKGGGEWSIFSLKAKPRSKESSCSSILAKHKSRKYHKNIYANKSLHSPPALSNDILLLRFWRKFDYKNIKLASESV